MSRICSAHGADWLSRVQSRHGGLRKDLEGTREVVKLAAHDDPLDYPEGPHVFFGKVLAGYRLLDRGSNEQETVQGSSE